MAGVKIPVRDNNLRYKGTFDFDGLYKLMRQWCAERQYDFFETRDKQKDKPQGYEIEINWRAERPINEYCKNYVHVYFHMWDTQEIEIIKDGKKKKVYNGRMLATVTGYILLDYMGDWEGSFFSRRWRDLYNFILRHEIEDIWWDSHHYRVAKLQQLFKRFLEMESHSDVYDDMW